MAQDPAFLFYSQDFFTGTAVLSFEDKGKYIHILCLMHQQGRLSEETIRFCVGSVTDNLRKKFSIDSKGLWYNKRLELESKKRDSFTKSRRDNGSKGGRPRKDKKPLGLATDNLMGNENDIIDNAVSTNNIIKGNHLVLEMARVFKNHNPQYPIEPKTHYPHFLQIAYRIATMKGWHQQDVSNGKMQDALKSWNTILEFVKTDDWLKTRGLIDLNGDKDWDRIIMKMMAKKNTKQEEKEKPSSIKKEKDVDFEQYKLK